MGTAWGKERVYNPVPHADPLLTEAADPEALGREAVLQCKDEGKDVAQQSASPPPKSAAEEEAPGHADSDSWKLAFDPGQLEDHGHLQALDRCLFASPTSPCLDKAVKEVGQDQGKARFDYVSPKVAGEARVDGMHFVSMAESLSCEAPHDAASTPHGISYIVDDGVLGFGSARTKRLTVDCALDLGEVSAGRNQVVFGWCVRTARTHTFNVEVWSRTILEANPDGSEMVELGVHQTGVLSSIDKHKGQGSSLTIFDTAQDLPTQSNSKFRVEEWPGVGWWRHKDKSLTTYDSLPCTSLEEARLTAVQWLHEKRGSGSFCLAGFRHDGTKLDLQEIRHEEWRTLALQKVGVPRPVSQHTLFLPLQAFNVRDGIPASISQDVIDTSCFRASLSLYLYAEKKLMFSAFTLIHPNDGDATYCVRSPCAHLDETIHDEDHNIPLGAVGIATHVLDAAVLPVSEAQQEGASLCGLRMAQVHVMQKVDDVAELLWTQPSARILVTLLVIAAWVAIFLSNIHTLRLLAGAGVDDQSLHFFGAPDIALDKLCFILFGIATLSFLWLEVRLALCCEKGLRLRQNRTKAFVIALGLSCLERYDMYGDLNFIGLAYQTDPSSIVWKVALFVFVIGVGILQLFPSLLLMCAALWDFSLPRGSLATSMSFTRLGLTPDLTLMVRFSGLHVLMESINTKKMDAISEELKVVMQRPSQSRDLPDIGSAKAIEADAPAAQISASQEARVSTLTFAASKKAVAKADEYCDVPPPPVTNPTELARLKSLAKVKRIVGAVRFLFEDAFQGILQCCYLLEHWDTVPYFSRIKVLLSVGAGVIVSALGPFLESRNFAQASTDLAAFEAWQAAGGEACGDLRKIAAKEKADEEERQANGSKGERCLNLRFTRPMRCLHRPGSHQWWLWTSKASSADGGGDGGDENKDVLWNGTVVGPGQNVEGSIEYRPQSSFPGAVTQLMLGFNNIAGEADNLIGLFDGTPGEHPDWQTLRFKTAAPSSPGRYEVGWKQDLKYTMEDAKAAFQTIDHKRVLGYIVVR